MPDPDLTIDAVDDVAVAPEPDVGDEGEESVSSSDTDDAEDRSEQPQQKMVPEGVAARLREQRRKAEERAATIERQNSELRQRMDALYDRMMPERRPDSGDRAALRVDQNDPEAVLAEKMRQWDESAQQFSEWQREQARAKEEVRAYNALMSEVTTDYRDFAEAEAPDFHDAYKFLEESLRADMKKPIYDRGRVRIMSDSEIGDILAGQEANLARAAKEAGDRISRVVYEIAKMRGYQAKQQIAVAEENERRREDGKRTRGMPVGAGGAQPVPTQEQVMNDLHSKDRNVRAKAMAIFQDYAKFDKLPVR